MAPVKGATVLWIEVTSIVVLTFLGKMSYLYYIFSCSFVLPFPFCFVLLLATFYINTEKGDYPLDGYRSSGSLAASCHHVCIAASSIRAKSGMDQMSACSICRSSTIMRLPIWAC